MQQKLVREIGLPIAIEAPPVRRTTAARRAFETH